MFIARKTPSKWRWRTSSGLSAAYGVVGGTGATFVLDDPRGGTASFNYISVGVGLSYGLPFSLGGSTPDMYSKGELFISDNFPGSELVNSDLTGFCVVMEASVAVSKGGTAAVMLLGIPAADMPESWIRDIGLGMALTVGATKGRSLIEDHPFLTLAGGVSPYLTTIAGEHYAKDHGAALPESMKSSAKAALFTFSESGGAQASIGVLGSVGYVWIGALDTPPIQINLVKPAPVDHYPTLVATTREKVPFPSDVLFDFDKWNIKPDAELALWGLAHEIQKRTPARIVIEGHTDAIGDAGYNLKLSQWRAEAVVSWLVVRRIVKPAAITAKGYGHKYPAFDDTVKGQDNSVARMRNRRIEVRFLWN
jgi:outer membrane protein OmpA-like peptidoglycan-associated protein